MLTVNLKNSKVQGKKDILKNIRFNVSPKKLTILMGPNGSGKSTLLKSILGHHDYKTNGEITISDKSFEFGNFKTEELIRSGVGYISQKNPEIDGLKLGSLSLAIGKQFIGSTKEYKKRLSELMDKIKIDKTFLKRELTKFSGGERKRIELMLTLLQNPDYLLIDEIDSGLDLDSLSLISSILGESINDGKGVFIITHSGNIIDEIINSSDIEKNQLNILILKSGSIVKKGGYDLIKKLEKEGYSYF